MWLPLSLQLFLFLLLLLLLLSVAVTCGSYWRRRGVAGPYGFPLVGNMLHFALGLRSYGDVYARLYNSYSSLSYVGIYRLFNEPALLLRDQSIVRELLIGGHFTHCAENAIHVNVERDVLAAQNPFIACGEHWRKQRGELLPLFTPLRLRQTLPHIAAACHQLQKFVAQRNPRELACLEAKELATRYTLQVVASAVFGLNAQCLDPDDSSRSESRSEWLQLLGPLFQPSSWSLAETIALLHSPRLVQLMEYRYVPLDIQRWLRRQVAGSSSSKGNTLLNWLRARRDCDIEGHATTLLLEGYETSAMLLAFALYELAAHPTEQCQLQSELDAMAAHYDGQLLHPEALDALHYAEATLYETLRLHPAMPALLKRCTESFVLPSQQPDDVAAAAGLLVAKETVLIVPVQAIHLDPAIYPQPLQFQPKRFLQQPQQFGCRFLGFGAGPRMCPGMRFGLAQTKAALATLLQDYSVELANNCPPMAKSNVTFLTASKAGIWLRFRRRQAK
ncbi:probable cytochrome P450 308a1 isoform X1 [Drosophila nasuta]|uniref:probable cytochrome P450 308a1 isoform X1 n=1 Tax=Drosophila nasuta TaxID=42062 RepID=UPI00295F2CC9|nr:probable cytochrome P450 308a1 isoform X1 [Drosophila nasuta]